MTDGGRRESGEDPIKRGEATVSFRPDDPRAGNEFIEIRATDVRITDEEADHAR